MGYTTVLFGSDSQIDSTIRDIEYGYTIPKFCFAVSFDQATLGGSYQYRLRFNISSASSTSEGPSTTINLKEDNALDLTTYSSTLKSGMMGVNTLINNLIFQT